MQQRNIEKNYEETEKLLKQLPQIKDQRSKEAIFHQIKNRLEDSPPKKKSRTWLMPSVTAAAAVVLLAILIPSMLGQQQNQALDTNQEESMRSMVTEEKGASLAITESSEAGMSIEDTGSNYMPAVKAEELGPDQSALIYPMVDANAEFTVPITVISALKTNGVYPDLQMQYGLGASPLEGVAYTVAADNEKVVELNIPQERVPSSSAETILFEQAINMAFSPQGYESVRFFTDGNPGMEYGNFGIKEEASIQRNMSGYFLHETSDGFRFLVPGSAVLDEMPDGLQATLERMKTASDAKGYKASVIDSVQISEVSKSGESLMITFDPSVALGNNDDTLIMIEAILLTAKDYGFKDVLFKNAGIDFIGNYDLTNSVSTNLYPNAIFQ